MNKMQGVFGFTTSQVEGSVNGTSASIDAGDLET